MKKRDYFYPRIVRTILPLALFGFVLAGPALAQEQQDETLLLVFTGYSEEDFDTTWVAEMEFYDFERSAATAPLQRAEREVDAEKLAQQFRSLVDNMRPVFASLEAGMGNYQLDEIELHVVITAGGKLGILAASTSGSVAGGVKIVLRRRTGN